MQTALAERDTTRTRPVASTSPTVTTAEYFYDYAGDDPVNFTDPSGACWDIFCHPLRAGQDAQDWLIKHVYKPAHEAGVIARAVWRSSIGRCVVVGAVGAAIGGYYGGWYGAGAGALVGCYVGLTRFRAPVEPE
jgi:hypothetical protein